MQEILEYLVGSIVDNPKAIKIEASQPDGTYNISVPQNEIGRVIGKNGSVIKAIRLVASVAHRDQNLRLNLIELT